MTIIRNLIPGQYQIGDLVFGRGTTVPVETFDAKPYDINAQDYQMSRQDEMNFGQDQLKPTTIELTFHVRYNWLLPQYEGIIPNFWEDMPTVDDFQREWRADEVRPYAGVSKPLYLCDRNGINKAVYGRPGQFTHADNSDYTEAVECLAEFRRLDTYSYATREQGLVLTQADPEGTIFGTAGNAPSWCRILIEGPLAFPTFSFSNSYQRGPIELQMDYSIAADEIVEINSYPWSRRIVNNGTPTLNLAPKLIGGQPYLDRLRFANNTQVEVGFIGGAQTSATRVIFLWYDAYQVAR